MRAVNQISIDNYISLKTKLTNREEWVLEALKDIYPASAEQVAKHLNVGINIISGRMTGLKAKGQIVSVKKGFNSFGNRVEFWRPARTEREYGDN